MNNAVIIFVKNPVLGRVKTRLASSIGAEKALEIYKKLVKHTLYAVKDIMADVFVYFSDSVDENIFPFENNFFKKVQVGNNLGERMNNAFKEIFDLSKGSFSEISSIKFAISCKDSLACSLFENLFSSASNVISYQA